MFRLILFEPEIPPNTGNIIRVCANTGTNLHLVRPLGFALDDRRLRRAGLDYREYAAVQEHESLSACLAQLGNGDRVFALTTRGGHCYAETAFQPGDIFLFGPETRGLPTAVLDDRPEQPPLIIVNAWNEFVEGSYLEPDMKWGYGYLEAVKKVMSGTYDKY